MGNQSASCGTCAQSLTPSDDQALSALIDLERARQRDVLRAAREHGGVWDPICGRWIEWSNEHEAELAAS
jgi:hypothetical protein